jgi:hypothetical protein
LAAASPASAIRLPGGKVVARRKTISGELDLLTPSAFSALAWAVARETEAPATAGTATAASAARVAVTSASLSLRARRHLFVTRRGDLPLPRTYTRPSPNRGTFWAILRIG